MKDRILIDTSAWIESFRKSGNRGLQQKIREVLDSSLTATTNIIILELLQGCRDRKEYDAMKTRLESLEMLSISDRVWETAYEAGYSLKKDGLTVPTVDLVIASIARTYDYKLVHHDRHFSLIAKRLNITAIDFLAKQ